MKQELLSPQDAAPVVETTPFEITYGDFLERVRERRLAELEESHPGEATRNNNIAGNLVRAVRAFMKANDLRPADTLGPEMRDETSWEAARDRMGPKAAPQKSLTSKARAWALEAFRAEESRYDDEDFAERLARLRASSGMSMRELVAAISSPSDKIPQTTVFSWETGQSRPSAGRRAMVNRMEVVLEVPPGTLTSKMPKEAYYAASPMLDMPRALKRRISQHLPDDFDSRDADEQEEILSWVAENILSTPKELYEDGSSSKSSTQDIFFFALARKAGGRCKVAPAHLIAELDELGHFKTAKLPKRGMKRNFKAVWGADTHEKADYDLRAFFGALDQMGLPPSAQSLSILLAPEAIERFVEWRYERRGAYTNTLTNLLYLAIGLLQPEEGFLTQMKGFGAPLQEIPGFIDKETVLLAETDWEAACAQAKAAIGIRVTQIEAVQEKGRDPFEALLPVIDAQEPLFVYWGIIDEIRARMPGPEYPVRVAEALRSLVMVRIGLGSGLRSKNLRQLLICPKEGTPRTEKQLRRLERGEMRWKDGGWWIAIPDVAFKNEKSSAVEEWNEFPIEDPDGKLDADISAYLAARSDLLAGHPDPGTLLVKGMRSNAKHVEFEAATLYNAYRSVITTYGIYNPWTGRGAIKGLRPHGPHSVRHVLGTHLIKNLTASDAAAALFDTEEMIRKHYGKYSAQDRHRDAMRKAWAGFCSEKTGGSA